MSIEIECDCGGALTLSKASDFRGSATLTVEACEKCMAQAKEEGHDEGDGEGYERGYAEGEAAR